ncbi:MAG: sulfur carrier protein ThiS [Synechococcales bacterium]|nr:thiamine biosynthesis protein ThiS [Cyanobacteria bacterium REEB444]MEB3125752.1 sulfur carrier protein ThiS [Synechococcales bacterium]
MIIVQVNGQSQSCASETLLPDFLINLGFNLRLIAVEHNGEILHRHCWEQTYIKTGDRLEVVTIVGGG